MRPGEELLLQVSYAEKGLVSLLNSLESFLGQFPYLSLQTFHRRRALKAIEIDTCNGRELSSNTQNNTTYYY